MKKIFLFRLLALMFFSTASLVIKSETSTSKSICNCVKKDEFLNTIKTPAINRTNNKNTYYKYEGFFIKI